MSTGRNPSLAQRALVLAMVVTCPPACSAPSELESEGMSGVTDASSAAGTGGAATSAAAGGAGNFTTGSGETGGSWSTGAGGACSQTLYATIRDFTGAHPDFGHYAGDGARVGLVESELGADHKPVYASAGPTEVTTGPNEFHAWYNDTPGTNIPFEVTLPLEAKGPGAWVYDSSAFFPVDGMGYGDEGNAGHNFYFTTEVHTEFVYEGGEHFTFTGDDDLWVFVNDRLAIDLGGPHGAVSSTADFDAMAPELGITPGKSYSMAIFHAERAMSESNFHVETNIECFDSSVPK